MNVRLFHKIKELKIYSIDISLQIVFLLLLWLILVVPLRLRILVVLSVIFCVLTYCKVFYLVSDSLQDVVVFEVLKQIEINMNVYCAYCLVERGS